MPMVDEKSSTIENDLIRLTPSTVKPGILDLCWKPDGRNWDVYNNIVVVARRDGLWGNAEIQQRPPHIADVRSIEERRVLRVDYEYPPFSNTDNVLKEPCNHAALNLVVEIADGAWIRTQLFARNHVQAAAVNNYWGWRHRVDHLDAGRIFYAADPPLWQGVEHDYYKLGKWTRLPYDGATITFRGADGPIQWQAGPPDRATLVIETRKCPWDPSQGRPDQPPWFETVSIERGPFCQGDETWFGFLPSEDRRMAAS